MKHEEKLLGGLTSRGLVKYTRGKKGFLKGYTIYVTNRRIIGSDKEPRGTLAALTLGSMLGEKGLGYRPKPGECTQDEEIEALRNIENNKDIEIWKNEINEIILRPAIFLGGGTLKIKTHSEEHIIGLNAKRQYHQLKKLLSEFHHSILRVRIFSWP
jgi:hypothetical protein